LESWTPDRLDGVGCWSRTNPMEMMAVGDALADLTASASNPCAITDHGQIVDAHVDDVRAVVLMVLDGPLDIGIVLLPARPRRYAES